MGGCCIRQRQFLSDVCIQREELNCGLERRRRQVALAQGLWTAKPFAQCGTCLADVNAQFRASWFKLLRRFWIRHAKLLVALLCKNIQHLSLTCQN